MFEGVTQHYNTYYKCEINGKKGAGEYVNGLYDAVMRNDKQALENVLKVLISNTFFMICKRLDSAGKGTQENIDDAIQEIQIEVMKSAFRGFAEYVNENNFYGYLMGIVEIKLRNYKSSDKEKNRREQYIGDDESEESFFASVDDNVSNGPEKIMIEQEKKRLCDNILEKYMQALVNSDMEPHQLLTYCYAVLMPQIFNETTKDDVIKKAEEISTRKEGKCNSQYDRVHSKFTGKLGRKSTILIEWAYDAIHNMSVSALDVEFQDVFDMQDMIDYDFAWGACYLENMEKENSIAHIKEKEVVITSEYQKRNIKNWPPRVANSLLIHTGKQLLSDKEFKKKSVKVVEDLFR